MAYRKEIEDTPTSVEGLCKMARLLGYKDPASQLINSDGSVVGDLLYFFEDNPGACEAVVEWVLEMGTDAKGEELQEMEDGDAEDLEEEDDDG